MRTQRPQIEGQVFLLHTHPDATSNAFSFGRMSASVHAVPVGGPENIDGLILDLYDRHRRELLRYGVWLGMTVEDAEDLLHEAFLRLHAHLLGGKDAHNLRAWLFRVVHNLAISCTRSSGHAALSMTDDEWQRISATVSDERLNPEATLLAQEAQTRVAERMKTLSIAQLHCLQLRMEGFRYAEIGEILGVALQTVATHIRRAIEKMSEKDHD
jgi:RNA polymerase sigma-70 factor (ECF subfamily)